MAKQLTAMAVKNLTPGKARREVRDGGCTGLYLVIQSSGHKSWALRFRRPSGKTAKLTLGPVDLSGRETDGEPTIGAPLTLASARGLAAEVHRQRARGRDVVSDHDTARRRKRSEHTTRALNSFPAAARDFIEGHAKVKTRQWDQQARMLGLDAKLEPIKGSLVERWKEKPIAEIDGNEVHALIHEVRTLGIPGLETKHDKPSEARARSMFSCLSKMFSWLVQHRRIEKNPCSGVHRPDAPRSRDRVLSDPEIISFWLASTEERKEFASLLKMLLLTGCRLNEVAGMRRDELNEDGTVWTIPGSRSKNHRPHKVPLSAMARSLVESAASDGDWIFTTNGETPVSGFSKIKSRLDAAMKIPPWRLHDLRRTAATGMAGIGIAPHIVEATLNHVSGAKAGVAGTYNRAEYSAEKKAALDRWASHVESLLDRRPANVVPLRQV